MITKLDRVRAVIECEFQCGCWFEFTSSDQVTQSCIYHNKKLLMRSDVKKHFAEKTKSDFNKT